MKRRLTFIRLLTKNTAPSIDIIIDSKDEFEYFESLFQKRKKFLKKKGLQDICKYSEWPDIIINPQANTTNHPTDSECPFR